MARGASVTSGWRKLGASFVGCWLFAACATDDRAPLADPHVDVSTAVPEGACSRPLTGCPCDTPGETRECGEVRHQSGDYVTCSQGTRLCGENSVWSECAGAQTVTKRVPSGAPQAQTLALGERAPCSPADVCDPLCLSFTDTADGIPDLDPGLCSVGGGLGVCSSCGYSGTHSVDDFSDLPDEWQGLPDACEDDDDCGFDRRCVDEVCQEWTYPCQDPSGEECNGVDLVAGPPCVSGAEYHVQVCNRGYTAATSGTLRVGFYAEPERVFDCAKTDYDAPNRGSIEFVLGPEPQHSIPPGQCIELNPDNSTATSPLDLSAVRGVFVNYDGSVPECHPCNNWNALDPEATCSTCSFFECHQDCAQTSLTGTVLDPAGKNPVPGVMVYVPSAPLAEFPDEVQCETCNSVFSGSPIASTVTSADGTFTLTNVPTTVAFPLAIQIGRFRRQVTVEPIARCGTAMLPTDLGRLPRTQRRCVGSTCAGEGDLPQMALVLADADPLQCALRKIGFDESEFTSSDGQGRIHLFNHNGMIKPDTRQAFRGTSPLFSDEEALDAYNLVIAPCDGRHGYWGTQTHSGPNYNSYPTPTALPNQRAAMQSYLDRGGRLLATHWMSVDFVHLNYEAPFSSNPYVTPLDAPELVSQPGWEYADSASYNAEAPVLHQFGENVVRGGNTSETPNRHNGGPGPAPPGFVYTIDETTALGRTLSDWAAVANASPDGEGTLTFDSWSPIVRAVRSPAVRLAYGDSNASPPNYPQQACVAPCPGNAWGSEHAALFQFETPWNAPPDTQCGRATVAEAHVAEHPSCQIRLDADSCQDDVPPDCSCLELPNDDLSPAESAEAWNIACGPVTDLTPAEKAFEFLLFSTSQCVGPVRPPPASDVLENATYTREYTASCGSGTHVVWRHFSWKAVIPEDTSIDFFAQTGESWEEVAEAPSVDIGTASATTTNWTSDEKTVQELLQAESPTLTSRRYLRVTMKFAPKGSVTPILSEWRQVFDCIADE